LTKPPFVLGLPTYN